MQHELSNILGISRASNLEKYLGLPLKGRTTRDKFSPIIDKVNLRLVYWKHKLLNRAGKFCLAKFVFSSLLVYAMQALSIPKSVCDYVDKRTKSCIWSKSVNTRGWNLP